MDTIQKSEDISGENKNIIRKHDYISIEDQEEEPLIGHTSEVSNSNGSQYDFSIVLKIDKAKLNEDWKNMFERIINRVTLDEYSNYAIVGDMYTLFAQNIIVKVVGINPDFECVELISSIASLLVEDVLENHIDSGVDLAKVAKSLSIDYLNRKYETMEVLNKTLKNFAKSGFLGAVDKKLNAWYKKVQTLSDISVPDYLRYTQMWMVHKRLASIYLSTQLENDLNLFADMFKNTPSTSTSKCVFEGAREIDLFQPYNRYLYNIDKALILVHKYKNKLVKYQKTQTIDSSMQIPKRDQELILALHNNWRTVYSIFIDTDTLIDCDGKYINYAYLTSCGDENCIFVDPKQNCYLNFIKIDQIIYYCRQIKEALPGASRYIMHRAKSLENRIKRYLKNPNETDDLYNRDIDIRQSRQNNRNSRYTDDSSDIPLIFKVSAVVAILMIGSLVYAGHYLFYNL
ncbi:hypothetical protein NEAUS03_0703 [Nematocida ausubeli]|nr:hypothetical protein NEAUS03_0703 [Nematocida ausubeli]